MLNYRIRTWWTPKGGYDASEYEDAYRIADLTGDSPLRIAIADGATGATFSGLWAGLLCEDYVAGRLTGETLLQRSPFLSAQWSRRVEAENLPWYAQEKVERDGSHAALLGITIDPRTAHYQALSVGDCALVHLRRRSDDTDNRIIVAAFPFANWEDFGTSPVLIGTRAEKRQNLSTHVASKRGDIIAGDTLLLMTDAIAAWFLRECAKERSPWRWFEPLERREGDAILTRMVRELRDARRLKDDDITIVSVQVEGAIVSEE